MSEQALWTLFCQTGRPEFYTLYCQCRRIRQQREQAGQRAQSA